MCLAQAPGSGLGGHSSAAAALDAADRGVWGSHDEKAIVLLEEAISMVCFFWMQHREIHLE